MSTLTNSLGRSSFREPRLTWRRVLGRLAARLAALDALHRERGYLREMDARMLRDVGVTRADVDDALRRPDEHLALILLRGGNELQR